MVRVVAFVDVSQCHFYQRFALYVALFNHHYMNKHEREKFHNDEVVVQQLRTSRELKMTQQPQNKERQETTRKQQKTTRERRDNRVHQRDTMKRVRRSREEDH